MILQLDVIVLPVLSPVVHIKFKIRQFFRKPAKIQGIGVFLSGFPVVSLRDIPCIILLIDGDQKPDITRSRRYNGRKHNQLRLDKIIVIENYITTHGISGNRTAACNLACRNIHCAGMLDIKHFNLCQFAGMLVVILPDPDGNQGQGVLHPDLGNRIFLIDNGRSGVKIIGLGTDLQGHGRSIRHLVTIRIVSKCRTFFRKYKFLLNLP